MNPLSWRHGTATVARFSNLFSGKIQTVKMENAPITRIPSSEGGKNGNKEKKIERGVAVKSKLDEYREISDLTGFENLKAMILAESVMKRKKRNRKKKKKTKLESVYREIADLTGFDNLKAMIEAEASMKRKSKRNKIKTQENEVNVADEQGQLGEDEGLNKVEEKERNERKERRKRRKRAKLEEYEKISDLSGFENLNAMIDAEAFMRRNKRSRENSKRETEFFQINLTVNAEEEKAQIDETEAFEVVEASKPESVQTLEMDEPWHLVIDPAKENEGSGTVESVRMVRDMRGYDGAKSVEVMDLCLSSSEDDKSSKAVQTTTAPGANDGVNCVEVVNLCSSLSEDDKPISDASLGRNVEDMLPIGPVVMEKKRKRRRKKKRVIAAKDKIEDAREDNDAKYNGVLRTLLRKPRYFDPQDWNLETCSNC